MTRYGDGWRNVSGHTGHLGLQLPFWRVCPSSVCFFPSPTGLGLPCGLSTSRSVSICSQTTLFNLFNPNR
ncbi:hypothetical protein C347_06406 [Cryptococcus neoformans AD2-60a]|nr:hypothetical protein C347_06406 [Cryptococcus neoformans var. grubii AD2-60a]